MNFGNTCYFNSCTQALSNTPVISHFLRDLSGITDDMIHTKAIKQMLDCLWNGHRICYDPHSEYMDVVSTSNMFKIYNQECVLSFIFYAIEEMIEEQQQRAKFTACKFSKLNLGK